MIHQTISFVITNDSLRLDVYLFTIVLNFNLQLY